MLNQRTLLIFPLLTQGLFSLFLPFFSEFDLAGLGLVGLFATLPAFLFALVCVYYQFHQRNLLQISVFAGGISFVYNLILLPFFLTGSSDLPLWEQSVAMLFYALMFALPAILYAMVILRLFLVKPSNSLLHHE